MFFWALTKCQGTLCLLGGNYLPHFADEKTEAESMKWDLSLSFPICGSRHQWSLIPLGLWVLSHSRGVIYQSPPSSPTSSYLITAGAPGPDTLTVMAATPGRTVLPEVDEVHQRLGALEAHKAGRMPLLIVACPVWVDHGAVGRGHFLAQLTDLEGWRRTPKIQSSQKGVVTQVWVLTPVSLLPWWPWASYYTSLFLSFLICKVG